MEESIKETNEIKAAAAPKKTAAKKTTRKTATKKTTKKKDGERRRPSAGKRMPRMLRW